MKGANKKFMKDREKFLKRNILLLGRIEIEMDAFFRTENMRRTAAAKPALDPTIEATYSRTFVFDLAKANNSSFDSVGGAPGIGKPEAVYNLHMMERWDPGAPEAREVSKKTNQIVGYYVPWSANRAWSVTLGDDADFFFTPTLNGCSVAIGPNRDKPKVTHANYVDNRTELIDQTAIDTELANRYPHGHTLLKKPDYTNVALKTARDKVRDYQAIVVGFRGKNGWSFYYQSHLRWSQGTGGANLVLNDRLVKIV